MNELARYEEPRLQAPCDLLIVEDDPTQAEELASYLRRGGLSVRSLYSGSEAIHSVAELRPKIAILDYNLPDLDGVTVAERIRRLSPETALLIMSGRIDGLSEATLGHHGIYQFLNKPVEAWSLRRSIRRMVRFAARTGSPALRRPTGLALLLA
ncbi:MAG: response regulator [Reyranella sp.]|nr:response regulator [Reyranella sp.]